jgi:hypothetical protein
LQAAKIEPAPHRDFRGDHQQASAVFAHLLTLSLLPWS